MYADFSDLVFSPAEILLPQNCDLSKWSVVACDQYTSQPEYWQRVAQTVGSAPSSLRLILPESCLDGPNVDTDIMDVNNTMARYLMDNRFRTLHDTMIYVERRLSNGRVRHGLVGKVDLEQYDYEPGSNALVRATEGTVLSRIPPRVAVRKNAPLELPHAMLLMDDPEDSLMTYLSGCTGEMEQVYDFELMEQGGHITGWALSEDELATVAGLLRKITYPGTFRRRYGDRGGSIALAVGDGNHSLATAKECYERQKRFTPPEQWAALPARYALVELTNLHDGSLVFEAVHRVLFDVDPAELLSALVAAFPGAYYGQGEGCSLRYIHANGEGCVTIPHPPASLEVAVLQPFLDDYLQRRGGRIDYIHGEDVAAALGRQKGNLAFLLPALKKEQLFPAIVQDGALPRKTFSMGEANDKRFYLEARRIR